MPQPNTNTVDLCTSCNTMKHLNESGLCGRCEPNTNTELREAATKYYDKHGEWSVSSDKGKEGVAALVELIASTNISANIALLEELLNAQSQEQDIDHRPVGKPYFIIDSDSARFALEDTLDGLYSELSTLDKFGLLAIGGTVTSSVALVGEQRVCRFPSPKYNKTEKVSQSDKLK